MTDARINHQVGVNYAVVMDLLHYSSRKLFESLGVLKRYFLNPSPIIERHTELEKELGLASGAVDKSYDRIERVFRTIQLPYHVVTVQDHSYPKLLATVSKPPPVLYVQGDLSLFSTSSVSVVGSRTPTEEGIKRAQKLAYLMVSNGLTVTSGLAKGIDSAAHNSAIRCGGRTIAVIGTPLDECYPKENTLLQQKIADSHLLVSQFPFSQPTAPFNFPARNYTMCGITKATIIVEASETSGALIQARFCLQEGRNLFVLRNLLDRKDLTWPKTYVKRGAQVLERIEDVVEHLDAIHKNGNAETAEEQLHLFETAVDDD